MSRLARLMGCEGTHQNADGQWMPCASHGELLSVSPRALKAKKRDERVGVRRRTIETLPNGSLVSGPPLASGKSLADPARIAYLHNIALHPGNDWAKVDAKSLAVVLQRAQRAAKDRVVGDPAGKRVRAFLRLSMNDGRLPVFQAEDFDLLPVNHPLRRAEHLG